MKREEKIFFNINKHGFGLEIGPSYNPIAPKKDGYKVHTVDHMTKEQLVEKFKNENVKLENIEDVDFIWDGSSYTELTGKNKFYDWIIASHLIEHTPNLIDFLNMCDSVLNNDAVISLVVPDKRYCFDHFRPITGISKIIDSYFQKSTRHTPGTAAEQMLDGVCKDGMGSWHPKHYGKCNFKNNHTSTQIIERMEYIFNTEEYADYHAWCFTPSSFRLIIHDLYCLGLIPFKEVSFFPTTGCEFYITIGRNGKGIPFSRMDMLKKIEFELILGTPLKNHLRKINKFFKHKKQHYLFYIKI